MAAEKRPVTLPEIDAMMSRAGLDAASHVLDLLARELLVREGDGVVLSSDGVAALVDAYGEIAAALDPSPTTDLQEDCPSVPWLTTVQTEWIDAVSLNYAVDPALLAALLPAPIVPEIWKGTAWVQILLSSLRDMRPQGLFSLFGVCFYQVSYRAAVCFEDRSGRRRRGGYFVRSETNDAVMRAVGNRLVEFKFHEFGAADMSLIRDGEERLVIGVKPESPHGALVGIFDVSSRTTTPPKTSVWRSLEELYEPLVECYDALGVDAQARLLYTLTIDRAPWQERFVGVTDLYSEYFDTGPLARGSRLDSVLHIERCPYKWRKLRRERF